MGQLIDESVGWIERINICEAVFKMGYCFNLYTIYSAIKEINHNI